MALETSDPNLLISLAVFLRYKNTYVVEIIEEFRIFAHLSPETPICLQAAGLKCAEKEVAKFPP
jgi:hypothetical protein